jgi:lipoprotein-anchoring transpeptidase ErfK/SrfK
MTRGPLARAVRAGIVALGAAALVAAAPAGMGPAELAEAAPRPAKQVAPRPIAARPTSVEAWTARIVVPVHPRTAPRANARRMPKLTGVAPYNGNPETLLVMGATTSVRHGVWYRVLLNSRPNDATGWVPAAAVRVTKTPYRVLVDLSERRVTLHRRGRAVARWTAVVGSPANPTPTGRFAVSEIVRQPRPGGFFGAYIISLTAHSEKLSDFDGGDGRIALHGTNRTGLLGRAVSHGCVRLSNPAITRIARVVPPGAPVDVVA